MVPRERNTREKIEARAVYAAEISNIYDENLLFLDESEFNQHTCRSYGHSLENTKAFTTVPGKEISIGVCYVEFLRGRSSVSIQNWTYNSTSFIQFIEDKLVPYFQRNPIKIIVMDNARIHHSAAVLQSYRRKNIVLKFLVPYTLELNLIDEFSSMIKPRYYGLRISGPYLTIEDCLDQLLAHEINFSVECQGFYRNMRRWIVSARLREPFIL